MHNEAAVPVCGPNDFHLGPAGQLNPGLGEEEEKKIRERRFGRHAGVAAPEPPAKAELRKQALALKEVEREQEAKQAALEQKEGELAEREAAIAARMKELGIESAGDAAPKKK
jgi:hypothetical protein